MTSRQRHPLRQVPSFAVRCLLPQCRPRPASSHSTCVLVPRRPCLQPRIDRPSPANYYLAGTSRPAVSNMTSPRQSSVRTPVHSGPLRANTNSTGQLSSPLLQPGPHPRRVDRRMETDGGRKHECNPFRTRARNDSCIYPPPELPLLRSRMSTRRNPDAGAVPVCLFPFFFFFFFSFRFASARSVLYCTDCTSTVHTR